MTTQAPSSYREVPTTSARPGPRYANIVLGAWLFLSAFLWTHYDGSFTNTWLVGALIAAFAIGALRAPALRWVNTALSAWLILTTLFAWPALTGTLWNNVLVGVLVFILSLMSGTDQRISGAGRRPV